MYNILILEVLIPLSLTQKERYILLAGIILDNLAFRQKVKNKFYFIIATLTQGKDMIDSEFISRDNGYFYELKNINKCSQIKTPQIDNPNYVNDIACGEDHSLILDSQDDIWAFGLNYNGQLGLGHNQIVEGTSKIPKFTKNKVIKIESEGDISFATTDKGEVFMWPIRDTKKGHNILFPKQVKLPEKITSVSCGGGFCIFLNVQGMLYSWGRKNIYGQLGHGDTNPRYNPTIIEIFLNNSERISQVSCGFKHVVVKSFTNKAYSWGLVFFIYFFIFTKFELGNKWTIGPR